MIDERKWRLSALGVRSSVFLIMLLGVVECVRDFFEDSLDFLELFASGSVESVASDIAVSVTIFLLTVIAYITYMCGLGSFAKVQKTEWDARGVRRVRSGLVWSFVAMLFAYIPLVGWLLGFIFSIVAFFVMLGGYNRLRKSSTFPKMARLGASLLFAALFVELLGDILGLLPFIGSLLQGILCLVVVFMVLSGWKKIERADVTDVVSEESVEVTLSSAVVENIAVENQLSQQSSAFECKVAPVIEEAAVAKPLKQKKSIKKYIIAGCASLLLVVGVVTLCFLLGGEESAIHFPTPKWDKFVVAKYTGVKAYKQPDKKSLRLCIANELIASCGAGRELCWSDRRSDSEWEVKTYKVNAPLPVIEELDGWYKVQVGDSDGCWPVIAYVEKRNFKEVAAEPVTFAQLEDIQGSLWSSRLVRSGKYEDVCLVEDFSNYEMDGVALFIGEFVDGAFVCMRPEYINIYKHDSSESLNVVCDKDDRWGSKITYAESRAREYELYPDYVETVLDVNKLTVEEVETVLDAGFFDFNPSCYSVYYYLPGVSESLISFTQMSDDFYLNN